jgi:glycosyltransferase involved in cell wall biosynthesis
LENSVKISSDLSSNILTIGTDYHNHRGGVGAVIDVYSRYYEDFNFIASHKTGSALYKSFVFFLSLFKIIATLFSNRKIKIIHIHGASYGSFYRKYIIFIICKHFFRKKIIYHIHGGEYQVFYKKSNILSKQLIKNFLAKADIVLCLSQSWVEYFGQNYNIKRLEILPNIIDYPLLNEQHARSEAIIFLFLGLICKEKGIFDLIEVIAENKEQYTGKIKLIIGGNGEIQHLRDLINKYHIEDIVEFLGWISSNEKSDILNNADVYILPSYHEGLPISILESMSYGKAVISTKVGGIPEIVRDNENGLLINPGDLEAIKQSLNFFLENPGKIKEYGNISELKVQKYLPHSVIKDLEEIYKSVLSNE